MNLSEKLQNLIDEAETRTGFSFNNLTEAFCDLLNGYTEPDPLVPIEIPEDLQRAVVQALNVTANGTYTAPDGVDGFSPVTVNTPQTLTTSGTVTAGANNVRNASQAYNYLFGLLNISPSGNYSLRFDGQDKTATDTTLWIVQRIVVPNVDAAEFKRGNRADGMYWYRDLYGYDATIPEGAVFNWSYTQFA